MQDFMEIQKSIIPACDVPDLEALKHLVNETKGIHSVGAYKVGFELALAYGLPAVIETIKGCTGLPVIYDHQKAGNDIPKMGKRFARVCKQAGVNAVILFPFTGPVSEERWIKDCQDADLPVIVGGCMSHEGFNTSDGGFISEATSERIYRVAVDCNIEDFVVPYNKPKLINKYVKIFKDSGVNFTLYSPGFTDITEDFENFTKVVGDNWHIIVGSTIYNSDKIVDTTRYIIKRTIKPQCKSSDVLVSSKIRCPKCNEKMELYGITDKAVWKYCCKNCYTRIEVTERG